MNIFQEYNPTSLILGTLGKNAPLYLFIGAGRHVFPVNLLSTSAKLPSLLLNVSHNIIYYQHMIYICSCDPYLC